MVQKIKVAVGKSPFSLVLALLFSSAFFSSGFRPETVGSDQMTRHLLLSGAMFLLQFVAFYLFSASVRQHLAGERRNLDGEQVSGLLLWFFILYKEGIKTIVGVSLTLGWLAGLLFIAEHCREQFILVSALLGVALSALAFLPAFFFSSLLDHIRYPQKG
ncbi:MAG TPA: hypothetical protein VD811_15555 [Desulfuromonadales bacterium]|nr:hypothetical protein [Desulfuromonadales bacterium]